MREVVEQGPQLEELRLLHLVLLRLGFPRAAHSECLGAVGTPVPASGM